MQLTEYTVRNMRLVPEDGFIRAEVVLKFSDHSDVKGGLALETGVIANVVTAYDAGATIETIEQALLEAARRMLSLTQETIASREAPDLRKAVAEARAEREARQEAEMNEALKNIQF